jgi:hypothetical protein
MPKVNLSVPHAVGQDEARKRIEKVLIRVMEKFGDQVSDLQKSWEENVLNFSFKTFGFAIKGSMAVESEQVDFECSLPIAAMMFKGKVEKTMRDELTRILS